MVIWQVGALEMDAGRTVQIENRNGLGTRRIHWRSGIKSVVSPIVGDSGEAERSFRDDPEHHRSVATLASRLCRKYSVASRATGGVWSEAKERCCKRRKGCGERGVSPCPHLSAEETGARSDPTNMSSGSVNTAAFERSRPRGGSYACR
jgi:hypothetical protein